MGHKKLNEMKTAGKSWIEGEKINAIFLNFQFIYSLKEREFSNKQVLQKQQKTCISK